MLLTKERSLCEEFQKEIVSKDKGSRVRHIAHNRQPLKAVRHYKLDGDIFKQEKMCDYLLINDSDKRAYFVELKGSKIDESILQLESGRNRCKEELKGYEFYFRLVSSKARTHDIKKNSFRKFQDKYGKFFKHATQQMEENL